MSCAISFFLLFPLKFLKLNILVLALFTSVVIFCAMNTKDRLKRRCNKQRRFSSIHKWTRGNSQVKKQTRRKKTGFSLIHCKQIHRGHKEKIIKAGSVRKIKKKQQPRNCTPSPTFDAILSHLTGLIY